METRVHDIDQYQVVNEDEDEAVQDVGVKQVLQVTLRVSNHRSTVERIEEGDVSQEVRTVDALCKRHKNDVDQEVGAEEDSQNLGRLEEALDDRVDLLRNTQYIDDTIGDEQQGHGIDDAEVEEVLRNVEVEVEGVSVFPL
jgi:hypothetical protein